MKCALRHQTNPTTQALLPPVYHLRNHRNHQRNVSPQATVSNRRQKSEVTRILKQQPALKLLEHSLYLTLQKEHPPKFRNAKRKLQPYNNESSVHNSIHKNRNCDIPTGQQLLDVCPPRSKLCMSLNKCVVLHRRPRTLADARIQMVLPPAWKHSR